MGTGQSKEVPARVAESGTVDIMITPQVLERWQVKQNIKTEEKIRDFGGAGDACSNGEKPAIVPSSKETETPIITDDKLSKPEESATEVKVEPEPLQASISEKFESEIRNPFISPPSIFAPIKTVPVFKQELAPLAEDLLESPDTTSILEDENPNMNKLLSNFLEQNDAMKASSAATTNDIENGTVVGSPRFRKNGLSTLLPEQKQPFEAKSFQPDDFLYEEVDETTSAKGKPEDTKFKFASPPRPDFFDEEAMIGVESEFLEEKVITCVPETSGKAERELQVPKVPFPIVVDQDAKGRPVFETVASWKVRDNAEKQIEKNNAFWQEQLERITAKVQDETWHEAHDFQRRVQRINDRHPDIYSTAHMPGGHCNMLSSQIAKCYERNPGQVLNCNELVRQFAKCANNVVLQQYGKQLERYRTPDSTP